MLGLDAGLAQPITTGLLVDTQVAFIILKDRGPQPLGLHAPHPGNKLPGPGNSLLLVIVAERPVAHHLKEGVMVWRRAHLLQVVQMARDTHTFLGIGHARVPRLLQAQKDVLELVHPCIGQKQGGITYRHQRGAGNNQVVLAGKKVQEGFSNFCTTHPFHQGTRSMGAD
jgi:hypothetical protein